MSQWSSKQTYAQTGTGTGTGTGTKAHTHTHAQKHTTACAGFALLERTEAGLLVQGALALIVEVRTPARRHGELLPVEGKGKVVCG